jgi:predicted nucleotidyltransferase
MLPILVGVDQDDDTFLAHVTERLAGLPKVLAVALGGSRASGTHRPDSDWDLAIYYRSGFSPDSLRALGWPGKVSELGGWGGGVFDGGAWLFVDGRHVDVHYRNLDHVELRLAEASRGQFEIERLMFHLAGIPTYLVVAELALCRVLRGELPRPDYPEALRGTASRRWWDDARMTLDYARAAHATRNHLADCAGAIALASCQAAHAILAARGQWITNEKALLDRAGLRGIDRVLSGLAPEPPALVTAVDAATSLLRAAVETATSAGERTG